MGMAASQARFLQLSARKTNIEYMGQQINQERLALANESAGLFEQSLSISAPTPPSSLNEKYYIPAYSFTDKDSASALSKKIAVAYNSGLTGAIVLYDTYLPDGSKQENVEIYDGANVANGTGEVGENVSQTLLVGTTNYESNVNATGKTISNIVFDATTGKLESFDYGTTGSMNTYTAEDIIYSGVFNETAFNSDMNEYEYEKATYDYEIERINLETSRIQQQDKSLELKLKKFDTEYKAITSEVDAVQKVIQKNIESTFKIFS